MKPVVYLIAFLALLCGTPAAWAGPAEEVAELNKQLAAAEAKGDVDALTAAYADNAAVTPFWAPFRVEGKAAIKDHFTTFFETYPQRQASPRQASTRVYANDSIVVTNAYVIARYTDKKGNDSVHYIRISRTVVKMGAEWKIVDQHVSRVPIP
jgi:uncharacterized protein (TIGR02246 family)